MASSAPGMLRAAAPLVRAAAGAARNSTLRAAATNVLRRLEAPPAPGPARHPLTPAALRFERARSVRGAERSEQTAVTVWFGEGPSLPSPGGGESLRGAARIGAGVLGAAALAAMSVIAARKEETRTRVIDAPAPARPHSDDA